MLLLMPKGAHGCNSNSSRKIICRHALCQLYRRYSSVLDSMIDALQ